MKIKYSPIYSTSEAQTIIKKINDNVIDIDGIRYEFDEASYMFEDIYNISEGKILQAYRDLRTGELYIEVLRYYNTLERPDWDTGEWQDI